MRSGGMLLRYLEYFGFLCLLRDLDSKLLRLVCRVLGIVKRLSHGEWMRGQAANL